METLSYEEFKKRYGTVGLAQAKQPESVFDKAKNYITSNVANSFKSGVQQIKTGAQQINPQGGNNPFRGGLNVASGAINTIFSPIAPVTRPIGKAVEYTADKISDNPSVQRFANTGAGQQVARTAEDVANVANIAGTIGGSKLAMQGLNKLATRTPKSTFGVGGFDAAKVESGARNVFQGAKDLVGTKGVVNDILPTRKGIINDQVTKALDLTAGDTSNIFKSTGNDVGMFLADRKLLGKTVKETQQLIDDYKNSNFTEVRKNISAVKNTYKASQVPRYTEALQELLKETAEVPGLQKSAGEIRTLLKKKDITLSEVQRVKELVDDHYSLYKNTGDVKAGVAKQGMANIRKDIRAFIESEVKNNTGVDIGGLNNNVATAKSIADAVKTRSTRGLTRSNIKLSDMGVFGAGSLIGTPLFGLAAVFAKKLIESPSVQLKIARYLADLPSDARARIQAELVSGKIPEELREVIKKPSTGGGGSNGASFLDNDPLTTEARKYKSAEEFVKAKTSKPDYGMSHRPTEGVRAFNLTEKVDGEQMIPKDMYEQWYGSRGTKADLESISVLKKIKGNPEAEVTIYRASPTESFNNGDWVTFSKTYAQEHATGNGGKVFSKTVKAKDVRWAMDDVNEFGYYPEQMSKSQLTDIWKKANGGQ